MPRKNPTKARSGLGRYKQVAGRVTLRLSETKVIRGRLGRQQGRGGSFNMPSSGILSGITIVIVEDYPDTLYGIAHFLTRHGAKVFISPNASEGVQTVREHCPDIVLSDIRLPKRDGFELLRNIRALGPENGGEVLASS